MRKRIIILLLMAILTPIVFFFALQHTPLDKEHLNFTGKWIRDDGSWIHISNEGFGNLKEGRREVTGGDVSFKEGNIRISILGIHNTYKIEKAPYEENGEWKMDLNGSTYVKE